MNTNVNLQPSAAREQRVGAAGDAVLYLLAAGVFAVGTEGFMIAGILPRVAADLRVGVPQAGQLVTVFAFAYALSSPLLTAALGRVNRRRLLIGALALFALGNLVAACAQGYWELVAARVFLACAAGLFVPGANAFAALLATPERRGRAIAIINGGITTAIALGVPIGSVIGNHLSWRMTFVAVALLAGVAVAGLIRGLPRHVGEGLATAGLRKRIEVARGPIVLSSLIVTTLWAAAGYTLYPYLAVYLGEVANIHGAHVGYFLFLLGAAAAVGTLTSGVRADRVGSRAVMVPALAICAGAFVVIASIAHGLPHAVVVPAIVVAVLVWGVAGWSFYPPQQARLVEVAGLKATPIALSLNASFMYLGFSIGAATGSLVIHASGPASLGWVSAALEVVALAIVMRTYRVRQPKACPACA